MKELYIKRFSLSNDSGVDDMSVNGSVTAQEFEITPDDGDSLEIARLIFYIEDGGTFDAAKWGNGITLANGINLSLQNDHGKNRDLLGFNLKSSGDLSGMCFDIGHHSFGTGNEILTARFTFTKLGAPIVLSAGRGDRLVLTVNDDMSGLVSMHVLAQGAFSGGHPDV